MRKRGAVSQKVTSILLVDDEAEVLYDVCLILVAAGYQTVTARDGLEALKMLQTQPVDLIVSAIDMPRMNGYQLYHRVRQNPQWVAIPFLFLTGRSSASDIRYGKALGVDDYLTKPVRSGDLLSAVRGKLRRVHQLALNGNSTRSIA